MHYILKPLVHKVFEAIFSSVIVEIWGLILCNLCVFKDKTPHSLHILKLYKFKEEFYESVCTPSVTRFRQFQEL